MSSVTQKPRPKLRQGNTTALGPGDGVKTSKRPGDGALLAAGSGTAMASVCAVGLYQIEHLVGGLWSVGAVLVAGVLCIFLARVFSSLMHVVPTGAGLIAYVSRAMGKRTGVITVAPYLLLMLFLVGFEALIVGELFARLFPLPAFAGAMLFLVGTWAVCQAGLRIGYRAQALATGCLFVSLIGISLLAMIAAADRGELATMLILDAPDLTAFSAAVGQALFLFMGFELLTSHVEVASKQAVKKALLGSVIVLIVFYSFISLGISCLVVQPEGNSSAFFVPQLAIAEQAGGTLTVVLIAIVCILASFSSFNGALLALSRLTYALASQGVLPRSLARMDPRTLTARSALNTLLVLSILFTSIIYLFALYEAAIFAAAIAAALIYSIASLVRERNPFSEPGRSRIARISGDLLSLGLAGLAVGVLIDAGHARFETGILLMATYGFALLAAIRASRGRKNSKITASVTGEA